MVFSIFTIFTRLCDHRHSLIPNHFHPGQWWGGGWGGGVGGDAVLNLGFSYNRAISCSNLPHAVI